MDVVKSSLIDCHLQYVHFYPMLTDNGPPRGGLTIHTAGLNHDGASLDLLRPSSKPLPMIRYLPVFPPRELLDCPSLRTLNETTHLIDHSELACFSSFGRARMLV